MNLQLITRHQVDLHAGLTVVILNFPFTYSSHTRHSGNVEEKYIEKKTIDQDMKAVYYDV